MRTPRRSMSRRVQRIADNAHMLADLEGRLCRVAEIAVAAVLHPHLHLISGVLAHGMFDAVARETPADCARYRREHTPTASAHLIAEQAACDRAAHGADTGGLLRRLYGIDRDDFARA